MASTHQQIVKRHKLNNGTAQSIKPLYQYNIKLCLTHQHIVCRIDEVDELPTIPAVTQQCERRLWYTTVRNWFDHNNHVTATTTSNMQWNCDSSRTQKRADTELVNKLTQNVSIDTKYTNLYKHSSGDVTDIWGHISNSTDKLDTIDVKVGDIYWLYQMTESDAELYFKYVLFGTAECTDAWDAAKILLNKMSSAVNVAGYTNCYTFYCRCIDTIYDGMYYNDLIPIIKLFVNYWTRMSIQEQSDPVNAMWMCDIFQQHRTVERYTELYDTAMSNMQSWSNSKAKEREKRETVYIWCKSLHIKYCIDADDIPRRYTRTDEVTLCQTINLMYDEHFCVEHCGYQFNWQLTHEQQIAAKLQCLQKSKFNHPHKQYLINRYTNPDSNVQYDDIQHTIVAHSYLGNPCCESSTGKTDHEYSYYR